MPDRIPELDLLAAEAREVTMMPAEEVRRRGDRRRTARVAGITAGALALVAVAGVGIWNSPLADGLRGPQWANTAIPSPEPTDTTSQSPTDAPTTPNSTHQPNQPAPGPIPPTWDNLPTGAMLTEPGIAPLVGADPNDIPPDTPVQIDLCNPGRYGRPDTFLFRPFAPDGSGEEPDYTYNPAAAVLGYSSAELAEEGFTEIRDAASNCGTQLTDLGWFDPIMADHSADVPFSPDWAGTVDTQMAFYSGRALPDDPDNEPGLFVDTLVVRAGERVLWVTNAINGWDHNCSLAPDPDMMQCPMSAHLQDMVETLVK